MELSWGTIVETINWTFFLNLLNFVVLLLVLRWVLYRPVIRVQEERRIKLEGRLAQAERRRHEAEELRTRMEEELSAARAQARELVETSRQEGLELLKRTRARALAEARGIISGAEAQAAEERQRLQAELEVGIRELARASAAKILGREV